MTTTNFSLHILSQHGRTAWALCADVDGTTAVPVLDGTFEVAAGDDERNAVLRSVIDFLVETEPVATGGYADLFIFDTAARQSLRDLGGSFGPITALARSQMKYQEGWDRAGWQHCLNLLGGIDEEEAAQLAQKPVIEAATDGSFSRGKLASGASCAWIREDGRFGMAILTHGGILEAELFGIRKLLGEAKPGERLRVFVDSKSALSAIQETVGEGRERQSNQAEDIVRSIRSLMERVEVELVWVKGHRGHPLNDGADRLAVLARRSAGVVHYVTRSEIARNIVADTLNRHRQHQDAAAA